MTYSISSITLTANERAQLHCRWLLSGTPIQNSIKDLFSYFRFLQWEPFCHLAAFRTHLVEPLKGDSKKAYMKLHSVLKGVLLRRTKASKLADGTPILDLPKCEQTLRQIEFSPKEREFYEQLHEKSKQVLQDLKERRGCVPRLLQSIGAPMSIEPEPFNLYACCSFTLSGDHGVDGVMSRRAKTCPLPKLRNKFSVGLGFRMQGCVFQCAGDTHEASPGVLPPGSSALSAAAATGKCRGAGGRTCAA
jgi:SNF2-related domain